MMRQTPPSRIDPETGERLPPIKVQERRKVVEHYYLDKRWSMRKIADMLEVSDATICHDVRAIRKQLARKYFGKGVEREHHVADVLSNLERWQERLEELLNVIPPGVDHLQILNSAMKVVDRQTRLLGLDQAPMKNAYGNNLPEEFSGPPAVTLNIKIIKPGNRAVIDETAPEDEFDEADFDFDDSELEPEDEEDASSSATN